MIPALFSARSASENAAVKAAFSFPAIAYKIFLTKSASARRMRGEAANMHLTILDDLLSLSRRAVGKALELARTGGKTPYALDATAGKGVDTEFLARNAGPEGRVIAFDVQEEAIAATSARLDRCGLAERVRLVRASHAELDVCLEPGLKIHAAMYNLGFLPRGATRITTRAASTIASLSALEKRIDQHGLISVHCYTGQENGLEESQAVSQWAEGLEWNDWRVARYEFWNKRSNREFLFLVLKL